VEPKAKTKNTASAGRRLIEVEGRDGTRSVSQRFSCPTGTGGFDSFLHRLTKRDEK